MKRRILVALLGLVMLAVVGIPVITHHRAKARLRAYKLQLRASGEKVTFEEGRSALSSEEMEAGIELLAAASRLGSPSGNAPVMKFLGPGRALAACRIKVLPTDESTNIWPGLVDLVEQHEDALAQVRATLSRSGFGFRLDYSRGASLALPHLASMKGLAQWLSLGATVELHRGRITNAWENLQALTALVAHDQEDSLIISELVRVAIGAIAMNATWEALQCPGWQEGQLQVLQARWQAVDFLSGTESALAMDRLLGEVEFAAGRRSFTAVSFLPGGGSGLSELAQIGKEVLDDPKQGFKTALHRYPGYWRWRYWQSYEDEIVSGKALQAGIDAARFARNAGVASLAVSKYAEAESRLRREYPAAGKWLGYLVLDTLGRFFERIRAMEIQRSLLIGAIALKRYELKYGGYPDGLGELCPAFCADPPRDPTDGKALRYRLNPDGTFLLYSIGENGRDDRGDPEPLPAALRQWWRARDAVWPWPGTPEQVQAELRRASAKFQERQARPNSMSADQIEAFRRRYGLSTLPAGPTNTGSNQ